MNSSRAADFAALERHWKTKTYFEISGQIFHESLLLLYSWAFTNILTEILEGLYISIVD